MKQSLALLYIVSFAQASLAAAEKEPVALSLRKVSGPAIQKRGIPRQTLLDLADYYLADFQIGTPPQLVSLIVDTGSWATWVNPDCTRASNPKRCSQIPVYDPKASSPPPQRFPELDQSANYGNNIGALLQGYTDIFTWGKDIKVPNQPFAIANASAGLFAPVLGLAPDGAQGFNAGFSNHSVLSTMARQKIINSRAFSLALGAANASVTHPGIGFCRIMIKWPLIWILGLLVFGGIDKNRYSGSFVKAPVLPIDQGLDGWR